MLAKFKKVVFSSLVPWTGWILAGGKFSHRRSLLLDRIIVILESSGRDERRKVEFLGMSFQAFRDRVRQLKNQARELTRG
jgi:hypothetical protein